MDRIEIGIQAIGAEKDMYGDSEMKITSRTGSEPIPAGIGSVIRLCERVALCQDYIINPLSSMIPDFAYNILHDPDTLILEIPENLVL